MDVSGNTCLNSSKCDGVGWKNAGVHCPRYIFQLFDWKPQGCRIHGGGPHGNSVLFKRPPSEKVPGPRGQLRSDQGGSKLFGDGDIRKLMDVDGFMVGHGC